MRPRHPWLSCFVCAVAVVSLSAQTPAPQTPPDLQALRDAGKLADPAVRLKAYDEILAKYPASSYLVDVRVNRITAMLALQPIDLAAIDAEIAAARTTKTPRTPHEVLNLIAMYLMNAPTTLSRAEALEKEALASIEEESFARDWQKRYTRNPGDAKELAAKYKEGKDRYAGTFAMYSLQLGRILLKAGRDADAKAAFERCLAASPLQGRASLELANLAEKSGDTTEMYRRLAWAAITGRLASADRARLEKAYTTLHPGAPASDVDADLDRLFRDSFKNPIVAGRYAATPRRTTRTVLAEMFTGAGCVPCLSVDLSFETMLDRYSRDEIAILMYHIHAPTTDPLSNRSAQARGKLYGVNGAPTTFIDGARVIAEGPRDEAVQVFADLDSAVTRRLETAPMASLRLAATMTRGVVTADAAAAGIDVGSSDLRLHVALVEREIRYSGENGQRFHPMVVRALAGPDFGGFPIDASRPETSAHATFDLDALGADNLRYYDDYTQEMKARGLTITFLEKKHVLDPQRLAVVAFVQEMKTRRVLQAAYVSVTAPTSAAAPSSALPNK